MAGPIMKRVLKGLLTARPITALGNATGFKKSDPPWLKWLKRVSTIVITVASAIAAVLAVVLLLCYVQSARRDQSVNDLPRDGGKRVGRLSGGEKVANTGSERDASVGIPMEMGHLLDANLQGGYHRLWRSNEVVQLPCGFQLATQGIAMPDGRRAQLVGHVLVGHRAPPKLGLESCTRLTLDAAADILDDLERRLAALERGGVEASGEGVPCSDERERSDLVRPEVPDEGTEGDIVPRASGVRPDSDEEPELGVGDCAIVSIHEEDDDDTVQKILHIAAAAGRENVGHLDTDGGDQ